MAEITRCVIVDTPEIAGRGEVLFPGAVTLYANGILPADALAYQDAVIVSTDRLRIDAFSRAFLAAHCPLVREWEIDLSGITTREALLEAVERVPLKAYVPVDQPKAQPVGETSSRPPVGPAASAPVEHVVDTPPNEPDGYYASAPPADHPDIPAGAETAVRPFKRKPRPRLASVDGNLARAPEPESEPLPAALSEDYLADHFIKEYGSNWRYVTEWGMWLQWLGDGWHRDKRNEVSDVLKGVTREALEWRDAQALTPDGKRKINSRRTAWSSRDLAAADRRISILAEELDADPFLLGVPGGVVDLKNGKLLDAEPEQYITRRCAVAPEAGPHPLFDRVLARACAGHDGMREYLLRWFGYMLTGDVREEAFMFLYGPGGSGKSTLIKCVTEIMGEYAVSISMDAFTESKHPRHSQEIAKLAGMRLVYASETDEGRRWNEALIKSLTGRDKITAHKMRMDDFEFDPTFKLLLFGNSIPHLKSVGEEIRRRIHLVEYAGSLSENERDSTLKDRLKAEYPAILHTLIQGCVDWLDCRSLGKPESVSLSVDEYLTGEDTTALFLDECTERDPKASEPSAAIYRRFKAWATAAGEYVPSQKRLTTTLKMRGFEPAKSGGVRLIRGLRLKASEPEYGPPGWQDRD